MSKQDIIDEFATLIDSIENTVEEMAKYKILQVKFEKDLLDEIKKDLSQMIDSIDSRLKIIS